MSESTVKTTEELTIPEPQEPEPEPKPKKRETILKTKSTSQNLSEPEVKTMTLEDYALAKKLIARHELTKKREREKYLKRVQSQGKTIQTKEEKAEIFKKNRITPKIKKEPEPLEEQAKVVEKVVEKVPEKFKYRHLSFD